MGAPGCDDAPIVEITQGGPPKPVTLIYPYYDNPGFLCRQFAHWLSYPGDLLKWLRLIVVDDGSPEFPARTVFWDDQTRWREVFAALPTRLFRIEVDVRWNWLAARNIGFHHAAEGWCLVTDMDHKIPMATAAKRVFGVHDEGIIYRFSRREASGVKIHPHPNSWFMTRAMFWRTGGYDEALSGFYGTDGDYRRRCVDTAPIRILIDELERHEHTGDSSTTRYLRKQPQDAGKKAILKQRGPGWRPKVLSFPYHEVSL